MGDIKISDSEWATTFPESDPRSRLYTSIKLNGALFHLVAFRVVMKDDVQVVDCDEHKSEFEDYVCAAGPDTPFETITVGGAEYVVFGEMACT